MQPRWCNPVPQTMQRHTGTPWQSVDRARPKKKPLPTPNKAGLEKAAKAIKDYDFKK